jgi:hypothetical protein
MTIKDSVVGYVLPYLTLLVVGLTVVILASLVTSPLWLYNGAVRFAHSVSIFTFYLGFFFVFGGFVALITTTSYAASRILTAQKRTAEDNARIVDKGMRFKKFGVAMITAGLTLLLISILVFH